MFFSLFVCLITFFRIFLFVHSFSSFFYKELYMEEDKLIQIKRGGMNCVYLK